MEKRHFLFLLDELPPTRSANGICVDKIIDVLLADGRRVGCIVWGEQTKEGVEIHKIPRKPFDRTVDKLGKKGGILAKARLLCLRVFNRLGHLFLLPIWPVISPRACGYFYKEARRVIDSDGVTDVIAVSYPGETLRAMVKLKKKYGDRIRTYMYPLDVTLFGTTHGSKIEKKISRPMCRKFMRDCGKYSDGILVLENAKKYFEEVYPESMHEKFITCGIPLLQRKVLADRPHNEGEIHIAFAGNLISGLRDPSVFLGLLDRVASLTDKRIFFDLYGKYDDEIGKKLVGCEHKFTFVDHGWVTESELNDGLDAADILVNMGNDSTLIPSKLFVYMSSGKPIIHQCVTDGDPCLYYLERYGNSYILRVRSEMTDADVDAMSEFMSSSVGRRVDACDMFETCTPEYSAKMLVDKK